MSIWTITIWIACLTVTVANANLRSTTENSLQIGNRIKWQESETETGTDSVHDEVERRPRSLIGDGGGLQTIQSGSIPVVSNIQTVQNVPVISNIQTVQQVPFISNVQQQPLFGGGIGGIGGAGIGGIGGGGIGGIGGAGIGGGFKRFHESYTVRARGFGGGLGLGKFGVGGLGGGLGGGGFGAGALGGRYKARYTKSYGGAFGGAGLIGAGGLGGGLLG